jgi:hypothetical protein
MSWSQEEVEATVADYFDMLGLEVRGQPYNKTHHRQRLAALLNGRTAGAIERKHQNISAILIELGFVYITGYKPLRNYQQLLFEVVSSRLERSESLAKIVREQVSAPAAVPSVDDILAALVEPPVPESRDARYGAPIARERRQQVRRGIDYLALEASNRSLGAAGEEFVTRFEIARLISEGCERLAARVERVADTRGDGLGFDVSSFEASGQERLIEVKTTRYGPLTPFFVSRNEIAVSRESSAQFQLYRAFNFDRSPKLFCKAGAIDISFRLRPQVFEASVL